MEGNGGDPVENGEYSVFLDWVILTFSDREQSESIEYKLGLPARTEMAAGERKHLCFHCVCFVS